MAESADTPEPVRPLVFEPHTALADIYADLVGKAEIAAALGVTVYAVHRWIERRASVRCPKPVRILKQGHLYSLREWKGWYALWRRTRGNTAYHPPAPEVDGELRLILGLLGIELPSPDNGPSKSS